MRLTLLVLLPFVVFFSGAFVVGSEEIPANVFVDSYPEHLDGPYTGGFGEQTCHSCHFDYDLNNDQGSVALQGVGNTYQPGKQYEVVITVQSEQLEVGGFQMTARFDDGTQAGSFEWNSDRITMTPATSSDVQYVQHSAEGTEPTDERTARWSLTWEAPRSNSQRVFFNVASNAGNDDDSAFGDWIYIKELTLDPVN